MTKHDENKMDDLEAVRTISNTLALFEADEQNRIMRWVHEKMGLKLPVETVVKHELRGASAGGDILQDASNQAYTTKDIKTFIGEKAPSSDNQFAACVAYFYKFEAKVSERKEHINASELQDATRQAGRARLGDPAKTLANATAQGWLDNSGRGKYELNTVGENLVAMALPASQTQRDVPIKRKRVSIKQKKKR